MSEHRTSHKVEVTRDHPMSTPSTTTTVLVALALGAQSGIEIPVLRSGLIDGLLAGGQWRFQLDNGG
eukprot:7391191-Pyramimonas_sp.AAC.1